MPGIKILSFEDSLAKWKKTYKPTKQKAHKPKKPKTPPKQTHKDRKIHQQEGYRDSTEELTSRILLTIADAQEKKVLQWEGKGTGD